MRTLILMILVVVSSSAMAAKNVKITGQVFVVTQERENIKLALVEIYAIPEKVMMKYINARNTIRLEQLKTINTEIKTAYTEINLLEDESRKVVDSYSKMSFDNPEHKASHEHWEELSLIIKNKLDALMEPANKSDYLTGPGIYFESLPSPITKSKTDADGKFTLSLPVGKYVIAAKSSRAVYEGDENYYWIVLLNASSPNQSLMLSNDNLFESECNECIKHTSD